MTQQIIDMPELNGLCPSCFSNTGGHSVCPVCGYVKGSSEDDWNKLRPGTVIHDRYVIGRCLGQGGFGITYLGLDIKLKSKLAIKEYYPSGLAARNTVNMTVMNASGDTADDFRMGMEKFLEEARTLARFDGHDNIVGVRDFFERNGTAYMVMTYLEGQTLLKYLKERGGLISFDETMNILSPVMDALDTVHASGLIHRDISPDNIFITNSGQVKLLDFGAAKSAMALVKQQSHSIVLKKGYSPTEQYQSRGSLGPWTDVYSMAATLYRCVTGTIPPDVIDRLVEDTLMPPAQMGFIIPGYSEAALIKALSVSPQARFPSMYDFKKALLAGGPIANAAVQPQPPVVAVQSSPAPAVEVMEEQKVSEPVVPEPALLPPPVIQESLAQPVQQSAEWTGKNKKLDFIVAIILIIVLAGVTGYMLLDRLGSKQEPTSVQSKAATVPSTTEAVSQKSDIDILREKAEAGDAVAQFEYGRLFVNEQNVKQDCPEAVKWFRKSAEQGNPDAQYELGNMYLGMYGFPEDSSQSDEWYRKAAEGYFKAAKEGNAHAQYRLGMMMFCGQDVPESNFTYEELVLKAAEQGDVDAQRTLGDWCSKTFEIPGNNKSAAEWFQKAAEQGDAYAQYRLGAIYYGFYNEPGVTRDYSVAAKWFYKAAEQGNDHAQASLGMMYFKGLGVQRDYAKAAEYISKAANQEVMSYQFYLGFLYFTGKGVPKDYAKAMELFRKAGDYEYGAQCCLGLMYCAGLGVSQDYTMAIELFRKCFSDEYKDMNVGAFLSDMYRKGHMQRKNALEAYFCYYLAYLLMDSENELGLPIEDRYLMDSLENEGMSFFEQLSREDIAKVKKRAMKAYKMYFN